MKLQIPSQALSPSETLKADVAHAVERGSYEGYLALEDAYPPVAAATTDMAALQRFGADHTGNARERVARASDRVSALRAMPRAAAWSKAAAVTAETFRGVTSSWRVAASVVAAFALIGLRRPDADLRTWAILSLFALIVVLNVTVVAPTLRTVATFAVLTARTAADGAQYLTAQVRLSLERRRLSVEDRLRRNRDSWVAAHLALLIAEYRAQKNLAVRASRMSPVSE